MIKASTFFDKIENLLSHESNLEFHREAYAISITSSQENSPNIWIKYDKNDPELSIGIDEVSSFYHKDRESWENGMLEFLHMLFNPIKITWHSKGKTMYKMTFSFKSIKSETKNFISMTWWFPYWRKTKISKRELEPFVPKEIVEGLLEFVTNNA